MESKRKAYTSDYRRNIDKVEYLLLFFSIYASRQKIYNPVEMASETVLEG